MKRMLILAAGAAGAAGLIALAAPASADDAGTAQTRQFQQTLQSQSKTFTDSIDPRKTVNEFLNGNCTTYPGNCPEKDMNPGVLNQFDEFRRSLQGQSTTFGVSIDPKTQLDKFVKSITDPSDPAKG